MYVLKVAFFQKVQNVFQVSKSPKKKIFQKTILNLKFKFPANNSTYTVIGGNFKFQAQDSFLEYFYFGNELHFLKKCHLYLTIV